MKKIVIPILFIIFALILVNGLVFYVSSFTNNLQAENITISAGTNVTRYFNTTSTDLNITSATIKLSTENFVGYCYQETANVSTSCGGLNTGKYDIITNYFYINYSLPIGYIKDESRWKVKHGALSEYYVNISECDTSNKLQFRFFSVSTPSDAISYGECYNSTGWERITQYENESVAIVSSGGGNPGTDTFIDGNWDTYSAYLIYWRILFINYRVATSVYGENSSRIYEEAMNWSINRNGTINMTIFTNNNLDYQNNTLWDGSSVSSQLINLNLSYFNQNTIQKTIYFVENQSRYSVINNELIITYNKLNYYDGAIWTIAEDYNLTFNISINDTCYDYELSNLTLKINFTTTNINKYCYNGDFIFLNSTTYSSSGGTGGNFPSYMFDGDYTSGCSISAGNFICVGVSNATTVLKLREESMNFFSNTPQLNNLNFYSSSTGILNLEEINVTMNDVVSPRYFNIYTQNMNNLGVRTSQFKINDLVDFESYWKDGINISEVMLSTNCSTNTENNKNWHNYTTLYGVFSKSVQVGYATNIINTSYVTQCYYKLFANDTSNNKNETGLYQINITKIAPYFNQSVYNYSFHHNNNFTFQYNCLENESETITYYDNTSLFNISESNGSIFYQPTIQQISNETILISCGDWHDNSSLTLNLSVINYAPDLNSWSYTPSPNDGTLNITFNANTTDTEGDTIYNVTYWFVNQVLIPAYNNLFTMNETEYVAGDNITVSYFSYDAQANNTIVNYTFSMGDTTPPIINNVSADQSIIVNNVGYLYANCYDTASSIAKVDFAFIDAFDNLTIYSVYSPYQSNNYRKAILYSTLGTYYIKNTTCYDTSGNKAENKTSITITVSNVPTPPVVGGGGGGSSSECNIDDDCSKFGLGYYCVYAKCIKIERKDVAFNNLVSRGLTEEEARALIANLGSSCNFDGTCELAEGENSINCGNQELSTLSGRKLITGDCSGANIDLSFVTIVVILIVLVFAILNFDNIRQRLRK